MLAVVDVPLLPGHVPPPLPGVHVQPVRGDQPRHIGVECLGVLGSEPGEELLLSGRVWRLLPDADQLVQERLVRWPLNMRNEELSAEDNTRHVHSVRVEEQGPEPGGGELLDVLYDDGVLLVSLRPPLSSHFLFFPPQVVSKYDHERIEVLKGLEESFIYIYGSPPRRCHHRLRTCQGAGP